MLAGQTRVGFSVSLTTTVKLQLALLPDASVTVQLTVLVPFAKVAPEGGVQTKVAPGQLSAVVVVKFTTALHWLESVWVTILVEQVIVGGSKSRTTTAKLQPAVLPDPSVAVQLTVFVPFAKL